MYGVTSSRDELIDGLMSSRPAGGAGIFDLLYAAAHESGMAILMPDGVVCLPASIEPADLPADLHDWPRRTPSSPGRTSRA